MNPRTTAWRVDAAARTALLPLLAPVACLLSGCATNLLLDATEYKHSAGVKAEWTMGTVTEVYQGPDRQVLLVMRAKAPHARDEQDHHVVIPYGTLAEAVTQGKIEQREDYQMRTGVNQTLIYDVLVGPDDRPATKSDPVPFHVRYAIPRAYGLYGRPEPQPFPLRIARDALKAGRPDLSSDAWQDWHAIPVRQFEHPIIDSCAWHQLQTLDPPIEHDIAVYQGFCRSPPMAFALVAAEPLLGGNYSLAFHKPDADYYQAWYQRRWIGIGRVILPLTVAFDIVTAPIQIPLFIYLLHNTKWF